MTGLSQALEILSYISLAFFIGLNTVSVAFTIVAWRSLTSHVRQRAYASTDDVFRSPLTPPISIIVPAYNEEAGIVESIRSLLRLRYPRFEVIVVNDGSTDETLQRLRTEFDLVAVPKALRDSIEHKAVHASYASRRNSALWVIDKENGGKADALNAGLNASRYPYVCGVDADTMLEEEALLYVMSPLLAEPERVVAAGGIVRIANGCRVEHGQVTEVRLPRNSLAALQVLEYFRAFLVGLRRQRRRWQRGLVEAMWRHRRMVGNPRYGLLGCFALPYHLIFEVIGPSVYLAGFPTVAAALFLGAVSTIFVAGFLVLALLVGVFLSVSALVLEELNFRKHKNDRDAVRLVGLAIAENFGYRQMNDVWRTRALIDIARGRRGWGTMRRRGLASGRSRPEHEAVAEDGKDAFRRAA